MCECEGVPGGPCGGPRAGGAGGGGGGGVPRSAAKRGEKERAGGGVGGASRGLRWTPQADRVALIPQLPPRSPVASLHPPNPAPQDQGCIPASVWGRSGRARRACIARAGGRLFRFSPPTPRPMRVGAADRSALLSFLPSLRAAPRDHRSPTPLPAPDLSHQPYLGACCRWRYATGPLGHRWSGRPRHRPRAPSLAGCRRGRWTPPGRTARWTGRSPESGGRPGPGKRRGRGWRKGCLWAGRGGGAREHER